MGLKVLNPLIKIVAKKAYVAPKIEVRTLESLGLKMEQLTGDVLVKSNKINGTCISAIASEEEFIKVLSKLKTHKSWKKSWNIQNGNNYEIGLMPYAGKEDICYEINEFLRFGKLPEDDYLRIFPKEVLEDYIRITDYSLKKIDNVYGNFSGVVYRYGYMDAKYGKPTLSYVSTSRTPTGAAFHADKCGPYEMPYNIIFTKHGHKIENVQNNLKYCNGYIKESEILLEPGKNYQKIKEITPEMNKLKKQLFLAIEQEQGINPEGIATINFYREI